MRRMPLLLILIAAFNNAAADDRPVAFETERRLFAGIAGTTSQSRFHVSEAAGGSVNTLSDALLLRFGRFGRPARYGVDIMHVRYDEARVIAGTLWLDHIFAAGDIFSGYVGIAAGGVQLRWRGNDPFDAGHGFGVDDETESSWAAGLRVGGLIEVTDLVQVELGYRFLFTGLEADFPVNERTAAVEMRNQRVVHAGVNFRF